jgi:hypothetical protein
MWLYRVPDAMIRAVPDLGGHDLLRPLLAPMQRQLDLIQDLLERERRVQRDVVSRLLGPADAIFDLLEQSGEALRQQAEALEEAGRALEQTAVLVKAQAELFERTVRLAREPTELAKAVAGVKAGGRKPAPKRKRSA